MYTIYTYDYFGRVIKTVVGEVIDAYPTKSKNFYLAYIRLDNGQLLWQQFIKPPEYYGPFQP